MIYKDAILRRFDTVQKTQSPCNSTKNSCFIWYNDDDEDFVAHKMFDEMPIKKISKEGVKEASDVVENNFGNMVLDEVLKECDKVHHFESKDSSVVDMGHNCFAGIDNFVEKVDKNMDIDSPNNNSFVVVESVKELVAGNNGLMVDKLCASDSNQDGFSEGTNVGNKVIEEIKTIDVLNSESFEIIKSGLEKLIRNGIHNMKGQVGVGDFATKNVFDPGDIQEFDIWVAVDGNVFNMESCFGVENLWFKSKEYEFEVISSLGNTKGEYLFVSKRVFDPGGKRVFDLGGSRDDANFSNWSHQAMDFILDSIKNVLSNGKINELVEWIIGSLSLCWVEKKMCTALQGNEAGQVHAENQCHVQLLDFIKVTKGHIKYVDLIYCHMPSSVTSVEGAVRVMNYMIDKGWGFDWGTSEWFAQEITETCEVAKRFDIVEQLEYDELNVPMSQHGVLQILMCHKLVLMLQRSTRFKKI
ncbi:putative voltage-gated potassium channel subunit beta [Artemisia annua]|uniref:Putative voltage-gated potassium channel subunit beta n=1 Tax=Artemisia annua TaxID=35608 RepID=A0A2U1NGT7_ARTAN|nr:putative voltage-gated potassium channel subunit beta [Artemisia annua]